MKNLTKMKKKSIGILSTVLAGTLAFGGMAAAQTAVTTGSVNFRTAPSTSSTVIGTLPKGATIDVLASNDYWSKVTYESSGKTYTGYISNSYYDFATSNTSTTQTGIITSSVNFRTEPSTSSSVIGLLPEGAYVKVLIEGNSWSKVTYEKDGKTYTGYISNSFYKLTSSTNETSSTQDGREAVILGSVNFRTGPSLESSLIGQIPEGRTITVLKEVDSNWSQVFYHSPTSGKQYDGYISNRYYQYSDGQASTNTTQNTSVPASWMEKADSIINTGLKYWGVEYRLGADYDKDGSYRFDCSSYTQKVYGKNGIELYRDSRQQSTQGTYVKRSEVRPGDLAFFATQGDYVNGEPRIDHVSIIKEVKTDGTIILLHTYKEGIGVTTSTMRPNSGFWNDTFLFAKRVIK